MAIPTSDSISTQAVMTMLALSCIEQAARLRRSSYSLTAVARK